MRTYHVYMNITLSVDDEIVDAARRKAEALGSSLNSLVRDYLKDLVGQSDRVADAAELRRLSLMAQGNSRGWKFNREEIHERR